MANAAGPEGGRTGPYWRRQNHTTLPGERTGADLATINNLRRKAGLPPIGGAIGDSTRIAQPVGGLPSAERERTAQPGADLQTQFLQQLQQLRAAAQAPDLRGDANRVIIDQGNTMGDHTFNQGLDPRELLMNRLTGSAPQLTSRDALRQYVMSKMQRQAQPGPRRPILPARQPLRQARATQQPY